ncbi:macro domain-containing protein [Streptomyces parvus]|uniref:macro domain-containing protein n=1 Tax=Streptomyces parvus TaxID=66428 RepID=UPI00364DFB96
MLQACFTVFLDSPNASLLKSRCRPSAESAGRQSTEPENQVTRVRICVLGSTALTVGGTRVRMPPLTTKLLLRLVAAEGEAVPVTRLYRELWGLPHDGQVTRAHRTQVQQRISELRKAVDAGGDSASPLVRTEQMLSGPYPESAYRLVLDRDRLDSTEFIELVNEATFSDPATAVVLLNRALGLWKGRPLQEVAESDFAEPLVRRLMGTLDTARGELVRAQADLGHPELALPVAEERAAGRPDDSAAAATVRSLRRRVRARRGDEILRREFTGISTRLVVKAGDLFDQHDANMAVGFCDTFDTATENDVIISRDSVQGQLLDRVYGGDRGLLDRALRKGLQRVEPSGTEHVRDKPKGKRIRYPIGSVVPLSLPGRRVFAFVHCRQGNDLVTRSDRDDLRLSLECLWADIAVHGLRKPTAIPLVGSGLARVELELEQLMILIIDTFLASSRSERHTPELRIVVRPGDLHAIRISEVARFVEALDHHGQAPGDLRGPLLDSATFTAKGHARS